jgi:hypothetical protein
MAGLSSRRARGTSKVLALVPLLARGRAAHVVIDDSSRQNSPLAIINGRDFHKPATLIALKRITPQLPVVITKFGSSGHRIGARESWLVEIRKTWMKAKKKAR